MTDLHTWRENLIRLTFIYSYRSGSFILSSGRESNYYIDGKQVTMSPEGLYQTALYIITSLRQSGVSADAVGGLTLGADAIAAGVTALSHITAGATPLPSFIVRKEAKKHGTRSRIEGPFTRGCRAVIVDDVLTTGASVLNAAAAVEEAGGRVEAVYVLVDRLEGGRENITGAGYSLNSILTRAELEAMQGLLEARYPGLTASLQGKNVDWVNLPWGELSGQRGRIAEALQRYGTELYRKSREDATVQEELNVAPQVILKIIKAAEFHPDGEKEALRLLAALTGK